MKIFSLQNCHKKCAQFTMMRKQNSFQTKYNYKRKKKLTNCNNNKNINFVTKNQKKNENKTIFQQLSTFQNATEKIPNYFLFALIN